MIEGADCERCLTARATHERSRALRCVSALRVSVAIAWRTICEFIQSWSVPEIEPEPRRLPAEALPKPDPLKSLDKVDCKCRQYRGTDFWNDPHRWCGVDANYEAFWMKAEPRDCERTFRPKPKAIVVPAYYSTTFDIRDGTSVQRYSPTPAEHLQMNIMMQMQSMQAQMQGLAQQNTLNNYLGNQLGPRFSGLLGGIHEGY